ncbi:MAG: hypothetical protein ACTHLR_05195 [Rhizomicrobium sp.]
MKRFGKIAMGALMLAGTAVGATLSTTAPADAHVSVGIGIGVPGPGYYAPRPYYGNPCDSPRYRYYHPNYCYGYGPAYYGPSYYGYYDQGYYGPGYYEPVIGGFWFTDSFGHRHWHHGSFHGGGFHGHASWHGGGHWSGGHHHHH